MSMYLVLIYGYCDAKVSVSVNSRNVLQAVLHSHMRNSDSDAFDIHFYNLKLEKIVKLSLIKIIYFIINIFILNL